MRIAIFTDTYLPDKNGIVTSIDRFTKLMADDGHQIMIFCPKSRLHKDKHYKNINIKRYASLSAPSYKDMNIALPFLLTVVKDLKDFKPDIIHIQTPIGIGSIGLWASKVIKVKNIQTYHTYIPDFLVYLKPKALLGINRMAAYINESRIIKALAEADADADKTNVGSAKLQAYLRQRIKVITDSMAKNNSNKITDRFGRDFTKLLYNRADLVLTPSKIMKKVIAKQGVKVKIEVLSNGIECDFFKKKSDYRIKNSLVYIGRLGYEKNVDVVIKAFKIALASNPKLILDIYGDGPARKSLQGLAKDIGINDQVRFRGAYDIKVLSQQLCDYDYFVTASTIETQGLVILEAMASGLPVLGVDKFAVPEVVLNGKNGYVSKPFDIAGMAKNMNKIIENEDRLREFGLKSLEIAKSHEIIECKNRLVCFYEQVSVRV
jgi:glycosyltransferase involved in cell wall biosynthesis